jgi:hypothetical protein
MKLQVGPLLLGLAAASLSFVVATAETSTKSWTLYHSLNGQDFSRRGVVEWSIDNHGQDLDYKVINDADTISTESVQAMLEYGWYQVKLQASDNQHDFVLATVPACNLLRGNLRDEFHLTMSRVNDNRILSLSYQPLISPLAPKTCDDISIPSTLKFESKLELALDTPSMTLKSVLPTSKPPPGLAFQATNRNSKGSAGGAPGPGGVPVMPAEQEPITGPTSFIKRYWYVLLPLFLANFMGSGSPEEPSSQGGGGAAAVGAGGAAVAAAAVAASSSGSPGKKVRRGKTNK